MSKPVQPWWSSMGFGKPESPKDTDYADMGTAFGLDATVSAVDDPEARSLADELAANDRLSRRQPR